MYQPTEPEEGRPHEVAFASGDESEVQIVPVGTPPSRIWGGDHDRSYVARAVATVTDEHWPPAADEYARVVMDVCRAVVARVSRTGSPDWSTVGFGPGHGIAGVSVEVPPPVDEEPVPSTVILSVWELDVLEGGDGADDAPLAPDAAWVESVRKRLQAIAGPLTRTRASTHRNREATGAAIIHYAREEVLTERPAPRSTDDLVDLALTCGRLAEASRLTYELVEQRAAAGAG